LREALVFGQAVHRVAWTQEAKAVWKPAYEQLTAGRPGVLGMVTSRAEAHCLRLAVLYALLDLTGLIQPEHVRAALALWDYAQRSAAYIFGERLGDKDAEAILAALCAAQGGLTRTEINASFSRHKPAQVIASKLEMLLRMGLVRSESVETDGRPAERWFAISAAQGCEISAKSEISPSPNPTEDPSCASFASFAAPAGENSPPGPDEFTAEPSQPSDPAESYDPSNSSESSRFEEYEL
jgi:hypothetical protein